MPVTSNIPVTEKVTGSANSTSRTHCVADNQLAALPLGLSTLFIRSRVKWNALTRATHVQLHNQISDQIHLMLWFGTTLLPGHIYAHNNPQLLSQLRWNPFSVRSLLINGFFVTRFSWQLINSIISFFWKLVLRTVVFIWSKQSNPGWKASACIHLIIVKSRIKRARGNEWFNYLNW